MYDKTCHGVHVEDVIDIINMMDQFRILDIPSVLLIQVLLQNQNLQLESVKSCTQKRQLRQFHIYMNA